MSENYASPWGVWYVGRIGSPMYAARARLVIRHSASFIELDGTVGLLPRRAYEVYAAPQEQMPDPLDQVAWALGLTLAKPAAEPVVAAAGKLAVVRLPADLQIAGYGYSGNLESAQPIRDHIPANEGYVLLRCAWDEALDWIAALEAAGVQMQPTGGNDE